MKKIMILVLLMLISISFVFCEDQLSSEPIILDNFEDGDIAEAPNWWKFDRLKLRVQSTKEYDIPELGKFLLSLKGQAKGWYVGGLGMYLAQPVDLHTHFQLDVFGTGEDSGMLKIELYEDDNYNKQIEQNIANNYLPVKDDKWSYELPIDWEGWQQILVPFSEFEDVNPKVGNNRWDPDGYRDSGGLVNIQFIVVASSEVGEVNFKIDNVQIIKYEEEEEEH